MRQYFNRQVLAIIEWPQLRWVGVLLSLNVVQASHYWFTRRSVRAISDPVAAPVCWPFFEGCYLIRPIPLLVIHGLLALCCALAVVAAVSFATKSIRSGYWLLLGAFLVKNLIYILDVRFMGNFHYMPNWVTIAFLFLPAKVSTIPLLICLFYFAAGLLKINVEWVSGNALTNFPPVSAPLVEIACTYVLVLELLIVFGCLSRRVGFFWFAFTNLILFHAISYQQVGYYYPLTMCCLLPVFALNRYFSNDPWPRVGKYALGMPWASWLFLGIFLMAQLPQFFLSRDAAVTGLGRMVSLNMLDARTTCEGFYIARFKGQVFKDLNPNETAYLSKGLRTHCDPHFFLNVARHYCRKLKGTEDFLDLDFYLMSKRFTDPTGKILVAESDVCAKDLPYNMLAPTRWIHEVAN
jgi:hypothetical protein